MTVMQVMRMILLIITGELRDISNCIFHIDADSLRKQRGCCKSAVNSLLRRVLEHASNVL